MKNGIGRLLKYVLLVGFCSVLIAKEEFSSKQIKAYKKGIFEVVTLKLKDNVVYKDKFPEDLLPFHIRNDKFYSVGTAFLIKENTFVSAAHVFGIGAASLLSDNFAVRDTKGNVFKIKNIEKFSNYRDLIQFTVEGDTSPYYKFPFASDYEEGDVVYAAGNALGQGVIFRKGSLTSFTYEPINGQWKDIRYSAAASPGNSGGPLLNLSGEVVGIVTKKSNNENLNYAFPIKEFINFPSDNAEFYEKNMGEVESSLRHTYEWRFNTPLPKDILSLRAESEKSFYNQLAVGRNEFVEKFKGEIFPNHQNISIYLKDQHNSLSFGVIDSNGNGKWSLYTTEEEREIQISENQYLYYSSSNKMIGRHQFVLEKPDEVSLHDFVTDTKVFLDTVLRSFKWNRKIANTPVYIESYGTPVFTERHTDKYGRVWLTTIWHDQYSDSGIMTYCLPLPDGIACDLRISSIAEMMYDKVQYKNELHRIMISFKASLDEWKEYTELPDDLIAKQFKDANFVLEGDALKFNVGEFTGNLKNMKLTEDSSLNVVIEINPDDISELIAGNISFKPNNNEEGSFYVSKYYDQGKNASDNYQDFWTKLTTSQSPYNNEVIDEGKVNSRFLNLSKVNAHFEDSQSQGINYVAGCKLQSEISIEELNQTCDSFIQGLSR